MLNLISFKFYVDLVTNLISIPKFWFKLMYNLLSHRLGKKKENPVRLRPIAAKLFKSSIDNNNLQNGYFLYDD